MKSAHDTIKRFMIAFNRIDALYLKTIKDLGTKGNFFVLFYAIADGKTYSQKQICDDWSLPRTTLNSIVKQCVAAGLVRLVPRGNKEKDIILTQKGTQMVDAVYAPLFAAEAKAMKPFAESGIVEMMEKLALRFEQAFSRLTLPKE